MGYLVAPDVWPHPGNDAVEMANLFFVAMEVGVPAWELVEKPTIYYEMYRIALEARNQMRAKRS